VCHAKACPFLRDSIELLIRHSHHMAEYAILQHSSMIPDNYSNINRSQCTLRQEAKAIVCEVVSEDGSPFFLNKSPSWRDCMHITFFVTFQTKRKFIVLLSKTSYTPATLSPS